MERNLGQGWREEERLGNIRTFRRDKNSSRFLADWLQHQGFWVQIAGDKEAAGRKSLFSMSVVNAPFTPRDFHFPNVADEATRGSFLGKEFGNSYWI